MSAAIAAPRFIEFGPEHAGALAEFDNVLFAGYHHVPDDFYNKLFQAGAWVIGHVKDDDVNRDSIVSVASYFSRPSANSEAPRLERELPEWLGFLDGAAVRKEYRKTLTGLDLHGDLIDRRLKKAEEDGKTAVAAAVRPDNVTSVSNLQSHGISLAVNAKNFYGWRFSDQRVIALGLLAAPIKRTGTGADRVWAVDSLEVRHNSEELGFYRKVGELLLAGNMAYSCLNAPDAGPTDPRRPSTMLFAPPDYLFDKSADLRDFKQARAEIRLLCEA